MKIVFIGQKGIPCVFGGVEKHVTELAVNLVKKDHEVIAYTRPSYTNKKLKKYKGVELVSLPSIPTKHLDSISHTFLVCINVIFKRNIDIIHFHSIGPSSLIWLVRIFKPRTPVIATFHTRCYLHRKWGKFAKILLRMGEYICCNYSDKVITISKTLKKYTESKYKINSVYCPNGVNILSAQEAKLIKDRWGLCKDTYIVYIGRLIKHKGVHYIIEAYKKLKTDKKLVIVGDGFFTDEYVQELEELAENNKNIIFTGSQSGDVLNELFSNAYLFVQPSESEGLSIALLEALSYAVPVLVSDIPENLEAIGKNGFLFKNKDINNLSTKIKYLLDNPEEAIKIGKQGKEWVNNNYRWNKIVDNIINIYEKEQLRKLAIK